MNLTSRKQAANFPRLRWLTLVAAMVPASLGAAVEIEGFTEPYRTVDVASPDQGIVSAVEVQVGQHVKKGDVLAKLDDELHAIMLETARERKHARGRLESAEAEVRMRTTRLEKLQQLREQGFGRKEEVERAAADYEVAVAELKAVREDLVDKQWQFTKIEAEWRRRIIVAPMDGVIAQRLKEPGEYVAPNEPNIVTMVKLDPLLAKFSIKRSLVRRIHLGDQVQVRFQYAGKSINGVVEEVSPVVDAQSGTMKVKVRIENPHGLILSGERCSIDIPINGLPSQPEAEAANNRVAAKQ